MTRERNSFVQQWLVKANDDIVVIERLMEYEIVAKGAVGFHCQQAMEKFLKAFLIFHGIDIARTHNIEYLLAECGIIDNDFRK
ncbi:MAG: HEPN domain-containing protein [Bacteroidetes bacterium]|nr:HEPN domain-containing protein [Bacteroidota bacterium]